MIRAHDRLDPWGPERIDLGFAQLLAQYFNANRAEGALAKAPADFMPDWLTDPKAPKRKPLTPEEQNEAMLQQARSMGARIVEGDEDTDDDMTRDEDYEAHDYYGDEED